MILVNSIDRQFKQFIGMKLPQTHEILSYDPCFLNYTGSSSSSTGLNYTPNSWNVLLWFLFFQLLPSWSSLAWVLVPWTHVIFSIHDPYSFHYSVVQAVRLGWTSLNFLLPFLFLQLLGIPSNWRNKNGRRKFKHFTTPNSWNILLWSLLFSLLSSSSSSAVLNFI